MVAQLQEAVHPGAVGSALPEAFRRAVAAEQVKLLNSGQNSQQTILLHKQF